VSPSGYTEDWEAGTVTFTNGTGYSQPVRVEHRIEDMVVVADVQIDGSLQFTRQLTHDFPADESYVSSALAVGDTAETWEKSFRTDMMHTVNAVAAALPYLEKSKSASIIIVSSVSGFEVDFAAGSYGAFKAALIHYAKGLSNQLIAKGIRVNAVSPGNTYFEGGIWQNIERGMPDLYKTAMSLNPTGRMGTPQEVAAGVVFLASPVASRISGTNLIVDGALTKAV
jgi:NAD(P)-dependent dehydrogenase (short-subunit alcohol dehydrogenase family)